MRKVDLGNRIMHKNGIDTGVSSDYAVFGK